MSDQWAIWENAWTGRRQPVNGFARRCLRYVAPETDAPLTILEIGCGSGADALFFARRGHRVTAIDFSRSAVEETAWAARRRGLVAVTTHQLDYARPPLPFPAESFDLIYSHLSLHYFPDALTTAVFDELWRLLKPGAFLCVKCRSTADSLYGQGEDLGGGCFRRNGHVRHFFSKEYMARQLARFTIRTLRRTSGAYDGRKGAFIEAVAQRPRSS